MGRGASNEEIMHGIIPALSANGYTAPVWVILIGMLLVAVVHLWRAR